MKNAKLILFFVPLFAGISCKNFGEFDKGPPANLVYKGSPFVFTINAPLTKIMPSVSGKVESCVANPPLPAGLMLDATSCAISGTPTASQFPTGHTITAANSAGKTDTVISIEVNSNPPTALTYAGSPYTFAQANAITPAVPSFTGSATGCSAAPGLPAGLSIDNTTCAISGTPTGTQVSTAYTITVSNAFGSTTANINIAVTAETTPPTTPTAFNATPFSQTQIDLTWAASTDNVTAQGAIVYEICRVTGTGGCTAFTVIHTTGAGAVNLSSTGLTAGTTYYFVIRAKDAANNVSVASAEISATTTAAGTATVPMFTPVAGIYNAAQNVSISVSTPTLATICYTTNGTTPACDITKLLCSNGTLYTVAVSVPADTTLKAIGCKPTFADSGIGTAAYVIDTTMPTVTNVTSSTANGTYNAGSVISIQVTFSEIVNVTGTPTLTLSTGLPATTAVNYTSGTGTNTLTFDYTVAAGNSSMDIDYAGTSALTAGTAIRDAALNNAVLTLPTPGAAGSLGGNKAITIDASPPGNPGTTSFIPGGGQVTINWNNPPDPDFNGIKIVRATGATAPVDCNSGTVVCTGGACNGNITPSAAGLNKIDAGLATNTLYAYRLCSLDTIGNMSSGVTGTVTTIFIVYAGTAAGLSISYDGGNTFQNKTTAQGLGSDTIDSVFVTGTTVYAATNNGLGISLDGGNSFSNRTTAQGLGHNIVEGVYVSGVNVYAATNIGLSISTNSGSSFVNKTTAQGLGSNMVHGVFAMGPNIYAATDGGLSISTDSGTSFTNRTIAQGLGNNQVFGVFVDGANVYAATASGISISTNSGSTFLNKTTTQGLGSNSVSRPFASGANVYVPTFGGFSISTDTGTSFTNRTTAQGLGSNQTNAVYYLAPNIFVGTENGLSISNNAGTSFTNQAGGGLGSIQVRSVFAQ